jgi:hypothetical protein
MLSNKDGEVFGLRCSTRWLCRMKKGGPKAAPSPADLQRDAHRGDIAASFRGLAPTPLKADRRSYNATVVSQWSRALTSSTTVQIRANKKGGRSRPLACPLIALPTPRQRPLAAPGGPTEPLRGRGNGPPSCGRTRARMARIPPIATSTAAIRDDRSAQLPAVRRRLSERVKSTLSGSSRLVPGREGMRT